MGSLRQRCRVAAAPHRPPRSGLVLEWPASAARLRRRAPDSRAHATTSWVLKSASATAQASGAPHPPRRRRRCHRSLGSAATFCAMGRNAASSVATAAPTLKGAPWVGESSSPRSAGSPRSTTTLRTAASTARSCLRASTVTAQSLASSWTKPSLGDGRHPSLLIAPSRGWSVKPRTSADPGSTNTSSEEPPSPPAAWPAVWPAVGDL
mmetsp:Transcript_47689/g.108208  ORF Transcript_47689/g.108208 Transcript_47689/m.108208 type:complete len:208 (-) Transcript_47689:582-1205(-)